MKADLALDTLFDTDFLEEVERTEVEDVEDLGVTGEAAGKDPSTKPARPRIPEFKKEES